MEVRTVTAPLGAVSADPVAVSGQKDNHPRGAGKGAGQPSFSHRFGTCLTEARLPGWLAVPTIVASFAPKTTHTLF